MVRLRTHLIDWLTLRLPISPASHPAIYARLADCIGHLVCSDASGEVKWVQRTLDIEALRSDSPGLYWQIKSDGKTDLLVIAASPASLEHGLNVWGTLDIRHAAETLIVNASRCLQLLLPGLDHWQARRLDVTANYALPDAASVKHALTQLLVTTGARRRPSSKKGGDTVYWNFSSDLSKGKRSSTPMTALKAKRAPPSTPTRTCGRTASRSRSKACPRRLSTVISACYASPASATSICATRSQSPSRACASSSLGRCPAGMTFGGPRDVRPP